MRRRLLVGVALTVGLFLRVLAAGAGEGEAFNAPPDLSGRWVMVEVMPAIALFPLLGEVELTTVVAAFVEVAQQGTCLELRDVYCFTDVQMNPAVVESRVPDRFIQSLHPAPRAATLEAADGGWTFLQPSATEVRGAVLVAPEADPLPIVVLDPRVTDQDGDGHPGLTVSVSVAGLIAGDTYVVQRLCISLSGQVIDTDTIVGSIAWRSEQNVLAATDVFLTQSYSYRLHPDTARHVFVMRRVDWSWTCQTVRERLPDLFGLAGL